jgi:(3S)-linalool synthase
VGGAQQGALLPVPEELLFSSSFTQACLNAARMVSVMYSYNKEQRLLVLEDYTRMLLL